MKSDWIKQAKENGAVELGNSGWLESEPFSVTDFPIYILSTVLRYLVNNLANGNSEQFYADQNVHYHQVRL